MIPLTTATHKPVSTAVYQQPLVNKSPYNYQLPAQTQALQTNSVTRINHKMLKNTQTEMYKFSYGIQFACSENAVVRYFVNISM